MPSPKSSVKPKKSLKPPDPKTVLEGEYRVPAPTPRTDRNGVIEHAIVFAVVEAAQQVHSFDPAARGVIAQRVRDQLRATGDPAMVQMVLVEIVREKADQWIVLRDFTPGSFEHQRRALGIPDGAWKYALWADRLDAGRRKTSADYWIGRWQDRLGEIDPVTADVDPVIGRYRGMLDKLYTTDRLEHLPW